MDKNLRNKILKGEIDINNQSYFFKLLIKSFIFDLNRKLSIRNIPLKHFVLNTGDERMYLEEKGQDMSIEPFEVSNENFVYMTVPRGMVTPKGINILTDQLTNPYSNGNFNIEFEGVTHTFHSEFRRIPFTFSIELKYIFDTYTDLMEMIQHIFAKLTFIQNFEFDYMGQKILCTYKIPDSFEGEMMMEFDGLTSDDKTRKLNLSFDIESNFPVFYPRTAVENDSFITNTKLNLNIK